jgi:hypothetical protein
MQNLGRERKIRTENMCQWNTLSKILHWNMSYVPILRSCPQYYIGTCLMFWFLRSRPRYYIGTCLMFWFYVPVQSITLAHVFCSDFTFPPKVLHWNMSYVLHFTFLSKLLHWNMSYALIVRSRPKYYTGTCLLFWFYVPAQGIALEHVVK